MKKTASIISIAFMPMLSSCGTLPEMSTPVLQPGYTYEIIKTGTFADSRASKQSASATLKIAVIACDVGRSSFFYKESSSYTRSVEEKTNVNVGCAGILPYLDFKSDYVRSGLHSLYDKVYTVRINSIEAGNTLLHVRALEEEEKKRSEQADEQKRQADVKADNEKKAAALAKGCNGLYVGKEVTYNSFPKYLVYKITGIGDGEVAYVEKFSGRTGNTTCATLQYYKEKYRQP